MQKRITLKKKKIKSTIIFNKKIAKRFSKTEYYQSQAINMKTYDEIERDKLRLSTPRSDIITGLIDYYKNKASSWTSSTGRILYGIYEKNKKAAKGGAPVNNSNLLQVLAKPETLLLAYRAIKSNEGALTKAAEKSQQEIENMTEEQRKLYFKSQSFPDKFSLSDVILTSKLLQKGIYPWGSSLRVYVPKPGVKDKMRPITIPPFMDRIVQKAITLILEAIYEPYFEKTNRSFGFRPNKGVHDSITALKSRYTNGMKWAIEGDVEAAYDTVNREKLIQILKKRIVDKKFLTLIEARLNYEYIENKEGKTVRFRPTLGIPQGGIDSPYLFNIYMNELDDYIINDLESLLDQMNQQMLKKSGNTQPQRDKVFIKLRNAIRGENRKMVHIRKKFKSQQTPDQIQELKSQLYSHIKEIKKISHIKLKKSSIISNKKILRIFYSRYADDWILLTNGNKQIADILKKKISDFLKEELFLSLSANKTLTTDITKEPARFLGYELRVTPRGPIVRDPTGNKKFTKFKLKKRPGGLNIWLSPDRQRLINRLHMKGFCNKNGIPKEIPWLSCLEPQVIIQRFNAVMSGFANYYLGYVRNRKSIHRWIYIYRFSCLKTFAQKYKCSIKKIFSRFGYRLNNKSAQTINVIVRIKSKGDTYEKSFPLYTYRDLIKRSEKNTHPRDLERTFFDLEKERTIGNYPYTGGKAPTVTNDDYLEKITWVSLRTQALMDLPCAYCGTFEEVHQHHLKHVRKRAYVLLDKETPYKKIMALRNRKQIPLCENCHLKLVHTGEYRGPRLNKLAPIKTVDNRIVNIESFVKVGQEYNAKTLEEKGWKKKSSQENIEISKE